MSEEQENRVVRIELTPTQQEIAPKTAGRDAGAIEVTVQELEERIAPRLAANHHEILLAE